VITFVAEYVIYPAKIGALERFGRRRIQLVDLHPRSIAAREDGPSGRSGARSDS
jgi:hypothetical protein